MNTPIYINYTELRDKLGRVAQSVGKISMRPVLQLYFVLREPSTPTKDKISIVAAMSYLVLPIDLIPSEDHPVTGHLDELGVIMYTYKKVKRNITPEIEWHTEQLLDLWFPNAYNSGAQVGEDELIEPAMIREE